MLHRHRDEDTVENCEDHDDLVALLERYDAAIYSGPPKIAADAGRAMFRLGAGNVISRYV